MSENNLNNSDKEEEVSFELGDRVLLLGGQLDKLQGRIYYIDESLIRILPDGVSDRLVDIPIIDGDLDPALEIEHLYSLSKRANPAFVAQIDAQVGQTAETFGPNGEVGLKYTISAVNEKDDMMVLADETGAELPIEFEFRGIPQDLPFSVLRPRQIKTREEEGINQENLNEGLNEAEEEAEAEQEGNIFEDLLEAELAAVKESDIAEIREIETSQRIYPDMDQRNDMIQEMVTGLPLASQKNPEQHKKIRKLVEQCMLLRNSLVIYNANGEPSGQLPTSYMTLIDLLKNKSIPLARPVLQSNKILYLDHTTDSLMRLAQGNPPQDPTEVPGADIEIKYLDEIVKQTIEYMDTQLGGIQSQIVSADSLPAWFLSWETLNKVYGTTWSSAGSLDLVSFKEDKEFFQAPIPDVLTPIVDGLRAQGNSNEQLVTSDFVGKVSVSLMRGLGPRSTRLRPTEAPRKVESAEEGAVINTLLFPLSEQRNLGSGRSGRLANDIAFSQQPAQTMGQILERLEGIPDTATAGGILSIGEGGNTYGNIPLEEWLRALSIYPLGLADALVDLANYGFTQIEFNSDQQDVIVDKIDGYRALIKQYITELRESSTQVLSQLGYENNPFLAGDAFESFMKVLEGEPILASRLKDIRNKLPYYKENDIALVGGLLTTSGDLFLTTMAQIPGPLARERVRLVRDQFLSALREALALSLKQDNAGDEPEINTCPHVTDYNELHKVKEDSARMKLFAKFLTKYQGSREDNWVNCSACGLHLVCYHEVLLLQEFLHPREKDTLHKELLLSFGGEQFHGRYTCRNCGQPISELEYDTNMEFSDDGVPLMGRDVLEGDDQQNEILDLLLGPQDGLTEEIEFKTDTQNTAYQAARKLFDVLGVYGKTEAFQRIVMRTETEITKQPSLEAYKQLTKGKRAMDYDVYINRILVATVAVNTVIEIQTDVPGYVMRSKLPGCRAGFSGYPVGNEKDRTCIEYIACAVASIQENSPPWSLTGYLRDTSDKRRQESILADMTKIMTSTLTNANVQQQISLKRAHLQELYGSVLYSEQLPEQIPNGFTPYPYKLDPESATNNSVVPQAASARERIRGWILEAHKLGKDNGVYVKGSPFSDATCCSTAIQKPGSFWKEKEGDLTKLPLKSPPLGPVRSHLAIHFRPRRVEILEGTVSPEIMYRIFLKVCYDGPNIGRPHEPGYTNTCIHCGFVFPESPYAPRIFPPMSAISATQKDQMKEYNDEVSAIITKGKVALETQGINITTKTFEEVLDATHVSFKVDTVVPAVPLSGMSLFEQLRTLVPEPFESWKEMITLTMNSLGKLTPGADDIEVAEAYGEISNFAVHTIKEFESRIGAENAALLQRVLESSPNQLIETVRTYFLIPFQRLITGFHTNSLRVQKSYKLDGLITDDINKSIDAHLEYLSLLAKRSTGSTLRKLEWTRGRLSSALVILKKYIRGPTIPGGTLGLSYVTVALIGGILREFMDPNSIPPGSEEMAGSVNAGARAPIQILDVCIQKIRNEGLNYTDDQIREMINRRDELEKNAFIRRFENLTPEEKAVAKMNKKLGLKEWAVGGTKAIYAYDPEQYERERMQRLDMGFQDFLPVGHVIMEAPQEDGYENLQMREDDY